MKLITQPNSQCALLVVSCDAYADLWPPFFKLLDRHWPDCPFPVYLGTGEASHAPEGVTVLRSSGGKDWSRCIRDYLDELPHPHVLMMLDDFFLRETVPTSEILSCLNFARTHNAIQLRLVPRPKPTEEVPGQSNIGACAPDSPYRLSTQAAIWDRNQLRELLREKESIWEFEHNGNHRTKIFATGFYSVWKSVLPYEGVFAHHVVEKGRWLPHEKWIFDRQNIGCDFSRRATLPLGQVLAYHLAQYFDRALNVLGWRKKKQLKSALRRLLSPIFRRQFNRMSGLESQPNPPAVTKVNLK